jgi:hypothetical protein
VLAVLLVGGGVAYTYFLGPDSSQNQAAAPPMPAPTIRSEIKPTQQAANAPASASVSTITSPVAPGANSSVTVKANPLAKCTIVVDSGGVAAKDSGLAPKAADEFGIVSWAWTVSSSAPLGKWPVKVTCAKSDKPDKTAFVQADLVVAPAEATAGN